MSSPVTVTIAIPTRNRRDLLLRAVQSALAQTYTHVEVLVSNNASTDDTAEVLAGIHDPRLRVLTHSSLIPMMLHWDRCVEAARGDLFLLLSDDDFLEPTALEVMLPAIGHDVGIVYCRTKIVDGEGRVLGVGLHGPERESPTQTILEFFASRRTVFACSLLLRTADIREIGGYSGVPLSLVGDARVWMGTSLRYRTVAFVDEHLSNYCVHPQNATSAVRIAEWLSNNDDLARWCAAEFRTRGDHVAKVEVLRRSLTHNARVAVGLTIDQVRTGRGRIGAIRQLLAFRVLRAGFGPRMILLRGLVRIALPEPLFATAAVLRNALRRRLSPGAV